VNVSNVRKTVAKQVASFVESVLPADPEQWCRQFDPDRPKIIHDSLWGTFKLQPHEIALIDTPLVQRLRFIHQTGAVYLTYPSALHTRFEHTLGVLYHAARMCSILREKQGDKRFGQETENNLRFAAILHDTGHGPFSHTSEQYFSSLKPMADLQKHDPEYRESKNGAGEILSSLIIESRPFRDFVTAINGRFGTRIDCDFVRKIITGNSPAPEMYLSEVIHGPLDADKLDYMHRDGMFSGLRMHVDLDRLYASINVVTDPTQGNMTRIGGSVAGLSPLTQIMFNKMLLFTGIYHHHKVRTVDCMLWALFDLAIHRQKRLGGHTIGTPVDFLKLTDDQVLAPQLTNDDDMRDIIRSIRERRLWKRAVVISRCTIDKRDYDVRAKGSNKSFNDYTALQGNNREKILERRHIGEEIWREAGRPCKRHEVWLDVPELPSMTEAARMWIVAPYQKKPQKLGDFIPIAQWVELYGSHKWQSHVFCPSQVRDPIADAAIKVLKRRYGLHILPTAKQYAGAECTK